ncbi:hypothetical protein V8E54_010428 [Elaphomyces granulatus]
MTLHVQYSRSEKDKETRREIEQLWIAKNTEELEKRLRHRIQFGTAGLRGRMAAGFSCMNSLTVIQTSQGLAKYIKNKHRNLSHLGVVIAYDSRHNSHKFATLAASAFVVMGIKVHWYENMSPTPLVSFGVERLRAVAGIMITGSHNPAQDNGYKVYFKNGAQINSPMDAEISRSIEENLKPWATAWFDWGVTLSSALINLDPYRMVSLSYIGVVCRYTRSTVSRIGTPSPFIYTPLHGVGATMLAVILHAMGIGEVMLSVSVQFEPDPDFPTVQFPNPEEAGALDLAIRLADKEKRQIVIANDPDADRFAAAEKVNGSWFFFSGNHIGVLLASHIFDSLQSEKKKYAVVLNSTVSTTMLEKMARSIGIRFRETLTGFKWMGNIAREIENEGHSVIFAFEEAFGYMFPEVCHDKDGLTAAAVFLAAEAKWRKKGLSPYMKLQQLFKEYGHHETMNSYFRSPNPETTVALFNGIRSWSFTKGKPLGSFRISRWRDMTEGYDSETTNNTPLLPMDRGSQMLTIWMDRDIKFTLRGSGTEPKVKLYIESCQPSRQEAVAAVCDTFSVVFKEWILPFAPTMTWHPTIATSSGHIFRVGEV